MIEEFPAKLSPDISVIERDGDVCIPSPDDMPETLQPPTAEELGELADYYEQEVQRLSQIFKDHRTSLELLSSSLVLAKQYTDNGLLNIDNYNRFKEIVDSRHSNSREITAMLMDRMDSASSKSAVDVIRSSADQSANTEPPLITTEQRAEVERFAKEKMYLLGYRVSNFVDAPATSGWSPYKD